VNNDLRFFTSQELVRKRFTDFHDHQVSAKKARSISTHVEQGLNFIESASAVPVSIKPLTQYYGVAALCRAVTLFTSPTLTEHMLTQGHGLGISNWAVLDAEAADRGIGELKVEVTKGLFSDFAEATQGAMRFRSNSSAVNWRPTLERIPIGSNLTFRSLIGLMPDLWPEHRAWSNEEHPQFLLKSVETFTDKANWELASSFTGVEVLFPDEQVHVETKDKSISVETSATARYQPVQKHTGAFGIGDVLLVPPVTEEGAFSPLAIMYGVAYVMSMLARYRLSDWLAAWRGEKGDSARPMFEHAMEMIGERVPQLCADMMNGQIVKPDPAG
jgi:hypothetical protein